MQAELASQLDRDRVAIEERLADVLAPPEGPLSILFDAMAYATLGGGKRLRGFLVMEGARLTGAPHDAALNAAAAIECIHAYSLVHDDLPAMDDDDLRRGKPTTHIEFGEDVAILVGDGLQAVAFELIAAIGGMEGVASENVITLTGALAAASGPFGMVGGQLWDMAMERADGPPEDPRATIEGIQRLKTGALFEWSAQAGPILSGADRAPLAAYARALGRAFQVQDDLLDVTSTAEEMGKAVGKDEGRGKITFLSELGEAGARAEAERLVDEAIGALDPYGEKAQTLRDLARFVIDRRN